MQQPNCLDKHIFLTGFPEIPELHNVTKIKQNWATLDICSPEFCPQQCAIMPCNLLLMEVQTIRKKDVQHKFQESCNPHLELGLTYSTSNLSEKPPQSWKLPALLTVHSQKPQPQTIIT